MSDLALTWIWLSPGSDDLWWGRMSLAILIVSTLLPSVWLLLIDITVYDRSKGCLYNAETATFYPAVGFALSITALRIPVVACIQIHDIVVNGVDDIYVDGPTGAQGRGEDLRSLFLRGRSAILLLKMFELLCETVSELFLQSYKTLFDYFEKGESPDAILVVSMSISICTLTFGLTGVFLSLEDVATQTLAMLYLTLALVVRYQVVIIMFIKFQRQALAFVAIMFVARVIMTQARVLDKQTAKRGLFKPWRLSADTRQVLMFMGLGIFDDILPFFLPLGSHDEAEGSKGLIAIRGADQQPTVDGKLTSRWARRNLALTLAENAVGWCCVFFLESGPSVSLYFLGLTGFLPTALMFVVLGLVVALSKNSSASPQYKTRLSSSRSAFSQKYLLDANVEARFAEDAHARASDTFSPVCVPLAIVARPRSVCDGPQSNGQGACTRRLGPPTTDGAHT